MTTTKPAITLATVVSANVASSHTDKAPTIITPRVKISFIFLDTFTPFAKYYENFSKERQFFGLPVM